jgi:hypothetical protein
VVWLNCFCGFCDLIEERAMKNILVGVAASFAVGLLGGCANLPGFGVAADRVEVVDYRKVELIEDYAKRSGITVIWIRQPTRLVDRVAAGN